MSVAKIITAFPADDEYHNVDAYSSKEFILRVKGYLKLKNKGAKFHQPIHKGCVCHTVPVL